MVEQQRATCAVCGESTSGLTLCRKCGASWDSDSQQWEAPDDEERDRIRSFVPPNIKMPADLYYLRKIASDLEIIRNIILIWAVLTVAGAVVILMVASGEG